MINFLNAQTILNGTPSNPSIPLEGEGAEGAGTGLGFFEHFKGLLEGFEPISKAHAALSKDPLLSPELQEDIDLQVLGENGQGSPLPPVLAPLERGGKLEPALLETANEKVLGPSLGNTMESSFQEVSLAKKEVVFQKRGGQVNLNLQDASNGPLLGEKMEKTSGESFLEKASLKSDLSKLDVPLKQASQSGEFKEVSKTPTGIVSPVDKHLFSSASHLLEGEPQEVREALAPSEVNQLPAQDLLAKNPRTFKAEAPRGLESFLGHSKESNGSFVREISSGKENVLGADLDPKETPFLKNENISSSLGKQDFQKGLVSKAVVEAPLSVESGVTAVSPSQASKPEGGRLSMEGRIQEEAAPRSEAKVVDQVIKRISSSIRQGESRVRMQLEPKELGHVNIEIRLQEDSLYAKLSVRDSIVKEILDMSSPLLRESLSQQGIQVEKFDVDVFSDSSQERDHGLSERRQSSAFAKEEAEERESLKNSSETNLSFQGRKQSGLVDLMA